MCHSNFDKNYTLKLHQNYSVTIISSKHPCGSFCGAIVSLQLLAMILTFSEALDDGSSFHVLLSMFIKL